MFLSFEGVGSPTWTRTRDLRINSPSLYQLSYQGILFCQTLGFPSLVQRLKGAHITRYRDASQTPTVLLRDAVARVIYIRSTVGVLPLRRYNPALLRRSGRAQRAPKAVA